jgi:hypothetical protein
LNNQYDQEKKANYCFVAQILNHFDLSFPYARSEQITFWIGEVPTIRDFPKGIGANLVLSVGAGIHETTH